MARSGGPKNRRARVPKGNPVRGGQPPHSWLRSRHPRPRRTLAGAAGGAIGIGSERTKDGCRSASDGKRPRRPALSQ